jgi:predicted SnoaL-like aldol condensation-catalyzing enzyme
MVIKETGDMSEQNKKTVIAFYEKALNDRDVETAFRLYGGKNYKQHNPLVEDGPEGVRKFAKWIGDNHPNARGEIRRTFADGDFVTLHSHWVGLISDAGDAVVDIFRSEDGKVVEHWDVIQAIPKAAANSNTMF